MKKEDFDWKRFKWELFKVNILINEGYTTKVKNLKSKVLKDNPFVGEVLSLCISCLKAKKRINAKNLKHYLKKDMKHVNKEMIDKLFGSGNVNP